MANFIGAGDQSISIESLASRYSESDLGDIAIQAWKDFLTGLRAGDVPPDKTLSDFIAKLQKISDRLPAKPRVFISHRRDAVGYALRIAWLASEVGKVDYWLDVHDPVLTWATSTLPPTGAQYAAIIAGIIEMALLGCTHVIAAHTPPADEEAEWIPSQWIPYEFGRAKSRQVYSTHAAGWFHPRVSQPESRGEYVLLVPQLLTDDAVKSWLNDIKPKAVKRPAYHGGSEPPKLPATCPP